MRKFKNLLVLAFVSIFAFVVNAQAKTGLIDPTTLGVSDARKDEEIFIADGATIQIQAREDGLAGAVIFWSEEDGIHTQLVSDKAIIFGGGHNQSEVIDETNILMTGGSVAQIYGGSLHAGTVLEANVVISGGQVGYVMGGGAAFLARTNCPDEVDFGKAHPMNLLNTNRADAKTIVNEANVIINNGTVSNVFGGGESKAYTKDALVVVNGGVIDTLTGDGSNGYMDIATILVKGGKVTNLQAGNHGQLDKAQIDITGGEVKNLFATTDATDKVENGVVKDIVGLVKDIIVDVRESASVLNLLAGNGLDKIQNIELYTEHGTVENIDPLFEGNDIEVSDYIVLTVDGVEYEAAYDSTLAEYNLSEIIDVDGKTFVKFLTEDDKVFSIFTPLTKNVVLKSVFVENKATEDVVKQLSDLKNQADSLAAEISKIDNPNVSLVTYLDNLKITIEKLTKEIEDQKVVEEPTEPDKTVDENPNTYDAVLGYAFVTLFSLSGLGVATKKVFTK